ncbi:AimR family lysis-lysogeny pheromone receptor [Shouchella lonarensis]|uniref:MalT-like TPR region domain-containing protein n=1 Tax=Shouchella lonarensis TaxID=1464122 RepID=A0A1G6GP19_9BACI|nr:AimR family lysis-lysogeny pheromone receptor [Shouchella lonarensis]SDB83603.1 hypothetical protein SAMN05421737_101300 [Shouchella lonarensis]
MAIKYPLLFSVDTIRRITIETEKRLARMYLVDDKEWTLPLMRQLASNETHMFDFEQVIYAVKKVAKSRMIELMNEYTLSLQHIPYIKVSFEYAVLFGQKGVLRQLLKHYQDNENLIEWVTTYRLLLRVAERELSYDQVIEEARRLSTYVKEPILMIRLKLLAADAYDKLGKTKETASLLEGVIEELYAVEAGYMKSVLASRALLLVGNYFLYGKGDAEKAENNYLAVVTTDATPDTVKVGAYHGLLLVMMCKGDRAQCAYYFGEAIQLAKETGKHVYQECLEREYYPFVRNILGETFSAEGVCPEERAHQYIVRGEHEKALHLIDELEIAGKGDSILTWYKGKATGNKELLLSALAAFEEEHYAFLVSLIRQELDRLSANSGGEVQ